MFKNLINIAIPIIRRPMYSELNLIIPPGGKKLTHVKCTFSGHKYDDNVDYFWDNFKEDDMYLYAVKSTMADFRLTPEYKIHMNRPNYVGINLINQSRVTHKVRKGDIVADLCVYALGLPINSSRFG